MTGTAGTDRRGLVAVARVAKAHGIRGELSMDIHADSPLLFAPGSTLFLALPASGRGAGRPRPHVVAGARRHGERLILRLEGVADRNAAEALRGAEVLVAEADLPPPDEGEEYLHRLMGAEVRLADETLVGTFEAILDTPGQLTFVIRAPKAAGGVEILFPAVPEFILGLDAEAGLIHIDPPPGLLELYAASAPQAQDDGLDEPASDTSAPDSSAGGRAGRGKPARGAAKPQRPGAPTGPSGKPRPHGRKKPRRFSGGGE